MYLLIIFLSIIGTNNHKCNIGTIINHKFNNFCHTKMKKIQIFSEIQKAS